MKKAIRKTAAGVLCFAMLAGGAGSIPASAAGNVVINEVCTKNTTYAAPDGGFYDWVELYNGTGKTADISGWGLSDKETKPYRFTFPEGTSIPAGGHIIVFCDGDAALNDPSIAPFGLSTSGEVLTLTDKNGTSAESVTVDPLASDTSFGRYPDGGSDFFVLKGTPKAANAAPEGSNAVKKPEFSKDSGFFDSAFDLTISVPEGTTVYYTTDGSDPTTESQKYTGAIKIDDMSSSENRLSMRTDISATGASAPRELIDKAAVIRAIAVDSQGRISPVATKTYFVGTTAGSYYKSMKVVSLVTDPDNLFDDEKGIYVLGNVYKKGQQTQEPEQPEKDPKRPGGIGGWNMWNNWTDPAKSEANYTQKGREWEREASFEMFENGKKVVDQNVGIRIKGAYSRNAVQKSFNIIARMDYGKPELEYDFFNGTAVKAKNNKVIKSFEGITVRNGGNDVGAAYFRDSINQGLVADRDFAHQAMNECIVFIDGEFWGIYQLTERVSDDFINSHYGIKKSDVIIVKNDELEEGTEQDFKDWQELVKKYATADMTNKENYEDFCKNFDVQSYIDYFAAQIYWSNSDWPQRNLAAWKTNAVDETNPYADGKWRMFLFDTESGQGLYDSQNNSVNTNSFNLIASKTDDCSRMFINLLSNEEFREQYTVTMMDLANYNFDPEKTASAINYYKDNYKQQILDTYERFFSNSLSGQRGEEKFEKEYRTITNFYQNREQYITQYMQRGFGLKGSLAKVDITNNAEKGTVCLNTLTLDGLSSWSGEYFTDYPITVKALPNEGCTFERWEVSGADIDSSKLTSAELEIPLSGAVSVRAVYVGDPAVTTTASTTTVTTATTAEKPPVNALNGDYNGDGQVNSADLVLLSQFLHGKKVDIRKTDVITNGETDVYDLVELRKILLKNKHI